MSKETKELTPGLTDSQDFALRAFSKLAAPTIQEWAESMDFAYTTALYHLRNLKGEGYLTSTPGKARTIRLTDKAREYLAEGGK